MPEKLRCTPSTALYRQIIDCLKIRKGELGWSFWQCDEKSGAQSGYFAKAFNPDTPSGRMSQWQTLQWLIDAMYPKQSYRVFLVPDNPMRLGGKASPLARLMALLAMSGCHGYEAAKLLAEIGVELDGRGGIIVDPAKAAERRKYRRKRARGTLPTKRGNDGMRPLSPALNGAAAPVTDAQSSAA